MSTPKRKGNGERAVVTTAASALMAFGIEHLNTPVHFSHALVSIVLASALFYFRYHVWE